MKSYNSYQSADILSDLFEVITRILKRSCVSEGLAVTQMNDLDQNKKVHYRLALDL